MKTYHLLLPLLACTVPMNVSAGNNYVVEEATHDALVTAIGKCTSTNPNDPDMVTFCIKDNNKIALTKNIALGSKAIIIDGFNNATKNYIVLDGSASGRIFSNEPGANVELKNLKLTGCSNIVWPITGGANTNVFLNQCDFYDNDGSTKSNNGGAIRCNGASLKVYHCNFSNNSCGGTYGGGAICLYNNTEFTTNLEVEGTSFVNNSNIINNDKNTTLGGGAILIYNLSSSETSIKASIKNSTFYGNSTKYRGGSVYVTNENTTKDVTVEFINNTISGNSAVNNGGGLCFFGKANTKVNIALINNLITNNELNGKVNNFGWYNLNERVFITAYNNIVTEQGAFYNKFVNVDTPNGNQLIESKTLIYKEVQEVEVGSAKLKLDLPVLEGGFYKVAPLCEGSLASGAGIATLEGYTIPTKDAAGNTRPAVPAVGAMEISNNLPTSVDGVSSTEMKLNKIGNQLVVNGIESGVINVYNLLGELVLSSSIDETKTVSIESLSNGIYVANIESVSFKFIK
ncbi:MAG: T9SS type A sorting domain-containing protein [Bacteroidales bacterium]|nr:T9SS type A sorting domain-containing protein [Bacteroidales bacterium]